MGRLKGIGSFLGFTLGLFLALRVVHIAVPLFYPTVIAGPFRLDDVEDAPKLLGFSPRLPFYRPERLGPRPVEITVTRQPYPRLVIAWQGDRFLRLSEQKGGPMPAYPVESPAVPGHPGSAWWQDDLTQHAVLQLDGLWIEMNTDLPQQDALRIIASLRPYTVQPGRLMVRRFG